MRGGVRHFWLSMYRSVLPIVWSSFRNTNVVLNSVDSAVCGGGGKERKRGAEGLHDVYGKGAMLAKRRGRILGLGGVLNAWACARGERRGRVDGGACRRQLRIFALFKVGVLVRHVELAASSSPPSALSLSSLSALRGSLPSFVPLSHQRTLPGATWPALAAAFAPPFAHVCFTLLNARAPLTPSELGSSARDPDSVPEHMLGGV